VKCSEGQSGRDTETSGNLYRPRRRLRGFWGFDADRTKPRLQGLRRDLIDPAIAAHHGRIVKRSGDGSIVEFRSVVDAVRCAIEVQNGLVERNASVPEDRRIQFRVGIHVGDDDLMGDGVDITARLEGVAKPCLSEQACWQVKGRLDLRSAILVLSRSSSSQADRA
jgi:class 3 adenylate cyclase